MHHGERTLRHLLVPFQPIFATPGVTEVVVNRPGEIGVERNAVWSWQDCPALTFDVLDAIGILTGQLMGKEFDEAHPICLATLPDGQRFTACRPSVMAKGKISLTVRIPSQIIRTMDDDDFGDLTASTNSAAFISEQQNADLLDLYRKSEWREFFRLAVKSKKTIIATGDTGSGKTDLLKRLIREIPPEERLITLEDTAEFGDVPTHRNRVGLFYGAGDIAAEHLVEASLRMRPDRIAMQELRGKEAFSYMRVLLAGHPGSVTTLHSARGADDAFEALGVMVKKHDAGKEIPDDKLRDLIRRLIDVVVWCYKDKAGKYHMPYVYFRDAEEAA